MPQGFGLSHLTQVQQLTAQIDDPRGVLEAGSLPKQLQELEIYHHHGPAISVFGITSLLQLQKLVLVSQEEPGDLILLKKLRQLELLELTYGGHDMFPATLKAAPTWPQLQPLVSLELSVHCSNTNMVALMQAVSKLSSLTSIHLWASLLAPAEDEDMEEAEAASWQLTCPCRMLKNLTKLEQLYLNLDYWRPLKWDSNCKLKWQFEKGDMLHLSCLTGLTQLHISDRSERLDDAIVAAVLLELTGLQDLTL